MAGFFSASTLAKSKPPEARQPACGACGLHKRCRSPKLEPRGEGKTGVLLVRSAPGMMCDNAARFSADQDIKEICGTYGVHPFKDCWVTGAMICHGKGNATMENVHQCNPALRATIRKLKPKVIIPIGDRATRGVLSWLWRKDCEGIKQWGGWRIPVRSINAWVCPVMSPTYIDAEDNGVLSLYQDDWLDAAWAIDKRPYDEIPPDDTKKVRRVYDAHEAARILNKMREAGGPIAFDYEGNCLKPELPKARLISASVCWRGRRTIAFPWLEPAIGAFSALLRSPCPKIAHNMQFEERWTRGMLGHRVRNWLHDPFQASHIIDCQPGILSLSFNAFGYLGVPDYDNHIKPLLVGDPYNRIHEIALEDLLLYNGLDSLYTYQIAKHTMARIGLRPPENF